MAQIPLAAEIASRRRTNAVADETRPVVCHVLHGLGVGGAEVLAVRMVRRMRDRYRFVFACLDELGTLGRSLRDEGVTVHVLGRRPGVDWGCAARLAAVLRRERVALLHAHQYSPFFYATVARLLWRRSPVLFTEHGRVLPDYPRRKRMIASRLLLERRDRVVAVAAASRQTLARNDGIWPERIGVIHNGIDAGRYDVGNRQSRAAVRRELGLSSNDFLIVQVARLDPLKDHTTALRAMRRVVSCRADAKLVLVGDGPQRATIERYVTEFSLTHAVRLLGQRDDVPRLLWAADVSLLTSVSEGLPLGVIEAMAAGLPVIATRVGGVAEVVLDGTTGLLAPAGDDETIAEKLLTLATDDGLRRRFGDAGRSRARDHFSENAMLTAYRSLYEEMLGERAA